MNIKQVIRELPVEELSTPALMAAVMERVPEAEPDDIAAALFEIAEENKAEAAELIRFKRMRKASQ